VVGRATSKFVLASRVIDLILDAHEQRVATGDALQRLKKRQCSSSYIDWLQKKTKGIVWLKVRRHVVTAGRD